MISPSRETFRELAKQGNLIPVYRELVADLDTPVSAYLKLDPGTHSFLLESADRASGSFSRYSFLGANPAAVFTMRGNDATVEVHGADGVVRTRRFTSHADPLEELRRLMAQYRPVVPKPEDGMPPFYGGAVGYLAYEAATRFETTVPRAQKDDLGVPDAYFLVADTLVAFDHQERKLKLICNAHIEGEDENHSAAAVEAAYDAAITKLAALSARLERPIAGNKLLSVRASPPALTPSVNMTQEEYLGMAERMQEYIRSGDIFQIVPSQRFEVPYTGEPIDLYRSLRLINPSPYMFCLKMGGTSQPGAFSLVGSSPEVHVRAENGKITIRPIAGTRPRRENPLEDNAMAQELLADPKERAEHVMLVDLARNDVGRVCDYKSVKVTDFMTIERYSHVMHIVSNVEGDLRAGQSPYDVMRATFPAGTLTGAPKIRAMQIIAEQEPTCRGSYGGAVCYFGFSGNLDSCIAIRTALLKQGKAYLQAGGGLVADSTPMGEYNESVSKARANIKALALATAVSNAHSTV
ncbi:anthranilate synthase, component I [Verrucomicrobium sp. GAS474]|uniref:anthranilate synthase component I n=1 Tax=Verrucomicrobium sp. GAS474 TaxID=1882831 RepID=UPI00087A2EFA|nr:anthranilate synthase component I [Verrucomicrobium sp. GAS474]SDT87027.1 anthranilate synthase, component I [Verrucomicrobium sp. GAS474]